MRRGRLSLFALLTGLGAASLIPYGYALWLRDLRLNTIPFEWAFFAAFGLYALAAWLVLQAAPPATWRVMLVIFGFAILFRAILVFSSPTLSDDMYRYVWDGRVQAHQINPYAYRPAAPELARLRDATIWPNINRKVDVTVYPAGAELAFAALWRIWPDNVHWFQGVMVGGDLMAAVLLVFLLRALGRPRQALLIYLWNPLVIFEIAHSAHVDGLVLPCLVGAWLARLKGRDTLTGLLLGVAASLKLYPVLLLPVLWRRHDESGRIRPAWRMPLAFLVGLGLPYLPYISIGQSVLGFLPKYFNEQFNALLTAPIAYLVYIAGGRRPELVINPLIATVLLIIYLACLFRPAANAEAALRRLLWPIGAFTLLTQNLYPWYILWLVPLLAIYLPARQAESPADLAGRLLHTSWFGWWLFSGLIALAYTYYIRGWPNLVATFTEFIPLYEFLVIDLARWLKNRFRSPIACRAQTS
jgi:hypothetical protein